jgi:hypothetical protein
MTDDPKLRVFHIDTECYIIYVGKDPEDYRPFLRLGNSPALLEKAKKFISAVIITDSLTGNQLLEHQNLQIPLTGETRYIGDPEEVAKLKQFLEDNDIPSEGYEDEDGADTSEKTGAFVYFYKNGNIHIMLDKTRLFDLHSREKDDGHFVYRAERAAQAVKGNPFRYQSWDLSAPGFFFAGENPFFFREGKIGTLGISPDYIRDLGKYGFDPDLVLWLVEDRISEGLLCRFKRATVTKKDIRVATLDLRKFQNAVSLFTSSGLSCIIVHLEPGEEKVFSGFSLRRKNRDLGIAFPDGSGFPEALFPGNDERPAGRIFDDFVKNLGIGGAPFRPIEGIPYRIIERVEEDTGALIKTYLLELINELKAIEDAPAQDTLRALEILSRALPATPGTSAAKPLSDAKYKNLGAGGPPEIFYILWNIHEFARLCSFRKRISSTLLKNSKRITSLAASPGMPAKNETRLPVLGDLYKIDKEWFVFYRWNGVLTKLKLLQAQKSFESLEKLEVRDNEVFYDAERVRLDEFLGGLDPSSKRRKKDSSPAEEAPAEEGQAASETAGQKEAAAGETKDSSRKKKRSAPESQAGEAKKAPKASPKESAETRPETAVPKKTAKEQSRAASEAAGGKSQNVKTPAPADKPASDFGGAPPGEPPAAQNQGTKVSGGKGNIGKFLAPALIVAAVGGGAFLVLRGCRDTPSAARSSAGSETVSPAGQPPEIPGAQPPQTPAATPPAQSGNPPPETNAAAGYSPEIDPGAVQITTLDIYYCVNEIAGANGYSTLDEKGRSRPSPSRIYPGRVFVLPNNTSYVVKLHDTMWGIATDYIRANIHELSGAYDNLMRPYRPGPVPANRREETAEEIRKLISRSKSENLRRIFEEKLRTF